MKTVTMHRDFDYHPTRQITIAFRGGETYHRVTEFAARAIVEAGAGEIGETQCQIWHRPCASG